MVRTLVALMTLAASTAGAWCIGGTTVQGIDVSVWQGGINWGSVKDAGVKYAYARATNGTKIIDSTFDKNWAGMKNNGILRGAYQFFRPGQDAVAQANLILQRMGPLGPTELPPMIDVEEADWQPKSVVAKKVGQWLDVVEAATGTKPLIYTGTWFWDPQVGSNAYGGYPLR